MKQSVKMLVAGLVCCAAVRTVAVSGGTVIPLEAPAAPVTNLVQNINLSLTVYTEGATTTNGAVISQPIVKFKRTTKDLIQLLGSATTNTFSAKAKLIMATPQSEGDSVIYVQDGTNRVVVTGFFSEDEGSGVYGFSTNTVSHVEKESSYSLMRLRLHDTDTQDIALHFDLYGLSSTGSSSILKNKVILGKSNEVSASLLG
ncbi:MAG TPA: hypothetical protein VK327_06830, partial [Candidatus Paceibacterota bacterium]|nr:hypothetical protein [Candidatus Paceibacterota bacterium]